MKKATEFFPLGPGTLTYKRQWTQAETTELGTKGNKRYVSSHWNRQVVQSPSLENQGWRSWSGMQLDTVLSSLLGIDLLQTGS